MDSRMMTEKGIFPRPPTGKRRENIPKHRPGRRYVRPASLPSPESPEEVSGRNVVGLESAEERFSKPMERAKTAKSRARIAHGEAEETKPKPSKQHTKKGNRARGMREEDADTIRRMTLRLMQEDDIHDVECATLMDGLIKKRSEMLSCELLNDDHDEFMVAEQKKGAQLEIQREGKYDVYDIPEDEYDTQIENMKSDIQKSTVDKGVNPLDIDDDNKQEGDNSMECEGAVMPCDILVVDPSYGEDECPQHNQRECINTGIRKNRPLSKDMPDWDTVSVSALVELEMMKEDVEHEVFECLEKFRRLLNLEARHDGRDNGTLAQEVGELASVFEHELEKAEHGEDEPYVRPPMTDPNELYDYWQISSDHLFWSPPSPNTHGMDETVVMCTVPRKVITQCPTLDSIQEEDEYDTDDDDSDDDIDDDSDEDSDDNSDDGTKNETVEEQNTQGSLNVCSGRHQTLSAPTPLKNEGGNKVEEIEYREERDDEEIPSPSSGTYTVPKMTSEIGLFAGMLASVIISDTLRQFSENGTQERMDGENSATALYTTGGSFSSGSSVTIYERNASTCASKPEVSFPSGTNTACLASSTSVAVLADVSDLSMSKEMVMIQSSDGIVNLSDRQLSSSVESESISGSRAKIIYPVGSKCCVSVILTTPSNSDEPDPISAERGKNSAPTVTMSPKEPCTVVEEQASKQTVAVSAPTLMSYGVDTPDSKCTHGATCTSEEDVKYYTSTHATEEEVGPDSSKYATVAAPNSAALNNDCNIVFDSKSGEAIYISPITSSNANASVLPSTGSEVVQGSAESVPTGHSSPEQTFGTELKFASGRSTMVGSVSESQKATENESSETETVCEIKELITEVVNLRSGGGATKVDASAKKGTEKQSQKEKLDNSRGEDAAVPRFKSETEQKTCMVQAEKFSKNSKAGPVIQNCSVSVPCIKNPARINVKFEDLLQRNGNTEAERCVKNSYTAYVPDYTSKKLSGMCSQSAPSHGYGIGRPKTRYGPQLLHDAASLQDKTMSKGGSESCVPTNGLDPNSCACSLTKGTPDNEVLDAECGKCRGKGDSTDYSTRAKTHEQQERVNGEKTPRMGSTAKRGTLLSSEETTPCAIIKGSRGNMTCSSTEKYKQAVHKAKGSFERSVFPSKLKTFRHSVPSLKRRETPIASGQMKASSSDTVWNTPETKSMPEVTLLTAAVSKQVKESSAGSEVSGMHRKKSRSNSIPTAEESQRAVTASKKVPAADSVSKASTAGCEVAAANRKKSKSKSIPIIKENDRAAIIKEHIKVSSSVVPCLLRRRVSKLRPIPVSEAAKKAAARDELHKKKSSCQRRGEQGKNICLNTLETDTKCNEEDQKTNRSQSDNNHDRLPQLKQPVTVHSLPKIPLTSNSANRHLMKQRNMNASGLASQSDTNHAQLLQPLLPETALSLPEIPLTSNGEGYNATVWTRANRYPAKQMYSKKNGGHLGAMTEKYGLESQSEPNNDRLQQLMQPTTFSSLPKLQLTNDGTGYDATAWIRANHHLVKQICANEAAAAKLKSNSASEALAVPVEVPFDSLDPMKAFQHDMHMILSKHLAPEVYKTKSNPHTTEEVPPTSANTGRSQSDSNQDRRPQLAQPALTKMQLTSDGAGYDATAWLKANCHLLVKKQKSTEKDTAHSRLMTELAETPSDDPIKGCGLGMRHLAPSKSKRDRLNWPEGERLQPVGGHGIAGRSQSDTNHVRLPQLPQPQTTLSLPKIPLTRNGEGYNTTARITSNRRLMIPERDTPNSTSMTEAAEMSSRSQPDTISLPTMKLTSDGQGYDATAWLKENHHLIKQMSVKKAGGSGSKMEMSSSDKNSDSLPQIVKSHSNSLRPQMC